MWIFNADFVNRELAKPTSIFGLKLWVVIGICSGAFVVLLLVVISLCIASRRKSSSHSLKKAALPVSFNAGANDSTPSMSKDISEVAAAAAALVSPQPSVAEIQVNIRKPENKVLFGDYFGQHSQGLKQGGSSGGTSGGSHRSGGESASKSGGRPPEVSHLGWGHWYTLRELEEATNGLSPENVIGEGGYGIVYRGVLADNTVVAVKNLLNNRGQAEKEFKVEVEAIGRVRHKNLVRLLGYCVEGEYRMLVYEYVDNGNLDRWLQGNVGQVSPLTWEIRMNIILGTARGLAYLHEGLEPKVVHRDVKSSNILLDQHWNPKVSDFGLAKLLCSERNHVTTRVMGTFGYVAPEYARTGMLNERSDVYSFGVLIMELITGRAPVDYHRPPDEVHLVEWLKTMVGDRKSEEVLDPKISARPSPKSLKRAILVALRCVDPDARKRPKMGHVIHMLELDQLLLHDDHKFAAEGPGSHRIYSKRTLVRSDTHGTQSIWNCDQARDR